MTKKAFWIAGLLATAAAVAVHLYLLIVHLRLEYGQVVTESLCNIGDKFNCEAVSASSYSKLFGIPLAGWGAAANLVLLVLGLLEPISDESSRLRNRRNILMLAGFIAVTSIVMGGISLAALSTYCLFCILAYVLSFISFVGFWKGLPLPRKANNPLAPAEKLGVADLKGPAIAAAAIVLVAVLMSGMGRREFSANSKELDRFVKMQVEEWKTNPQLTIEPAQPLEMGDSAANAKMTIVEFADYRCIHCKHAAPVLHAFTKGNDHVRLVFQVYPLDGACNPAVSYSHGVSCRLAMGVHCAARQGKGWEAQKWVFERQEEFASLPAVQERLPKMGEELGLNWNEALTCMDAPETRQAIEQQAALGAKLNIQGTPTIFVNGRQLPAGQSLPVLQETYRAILEGSAK